MLPLFLISVSILLQVLGRQVYTSNNQLGGTQIMHHNGVSHAVAADDYDGVYTMLRWLSYMPRTTSGPAAVLAPPRDPVDRPVAFLPTKAPYNPRHMLDGRLVEGRWQSGFFDYGTWQEIMAMWAKTVVVGRARYIIGVF